MMRKYWIFFSLFLIIILEFGQKRYFNGLPPGNARFYPGDQ